MPTSAKVSFASYFNAFPASYWKRWTVIEDVVLRMRVRGAGRIDVYRSKPNGDIIHLDGQVIRSAMSWTDVALKVSLKPFEDGGWIWFDVFTDDIVTPEAGKARVRVIHAAADIDAVNVYAKGGKDSLFDGVDFHSTTSYKDVDPSMTTLELKDKNNKVVATPSVSIEAGKSYTIVVTGRAHGSPALQALIIEDRVVGEAPTN